MANILLIEDDKQISSFIQAGLKEKLHQVIPAFTGKDGIEKAMEFAYDIIILDIMLGDMSGFDVCRILRSRKTLSPIIILSALDSAEEKVEGLSAGADDYIGKPFLFEELLARIQAQIRRSEFNKGITDVQNYAGITVNIEEQSVIRDGIAIDLSPLEYKLLVYFMHNREKALSRVQIAQSVWGANFDTNTNVVDVYINFLRKKLDKDFAVPLIHTIKGKGYMFKFKEL